MDKAKIEEYKRKLAEIEDSLTDEAVKEMSKEEIQEYVILVSKIKARLEILENLQNKRRSLYE